MSGTLHVKDMAYAVGGVQLVDDISFSVPTGGLVALVGPNGAGKSTLLQLIAGTRRTSRPDEAAVLLDDVDLLRLGRRERARQVALIEQASHSEFTLTVRQVVELGRPCASGWGETPPLICY